MPYPVFLIYLSLRAVADLVIATTTTKIAVVMNAQATSTRSKENNQFVMDYIYYNYN